MKAKFDVLDSPVVEKKEKRLKIVKKAKATRKPRKLTRATQCLLAAIYRKCGGITKASAKVGIPYQFLAIWRWEGQVPLKHVGLVSHKLGVSQFALNYEDVIRLTGKSVSFKDVVESVELSKEDTAFVLDHKMPEEAKEILKYECKSRRGNKSGNHNGKSAA